MSRQRAEVDLLPLDALVKTSDVDHADWNYRRLLGSIQRIRFRLIVKMLELKQFDRLLEVGYGSGVFLPHLKRHCKQLFGIDPHDKEKEVSAVLSQYGTNAELVSGSVTDLPFEDNFFDCVVAVSALEYVEDIDRACLELRRVLVPGGLAVVVTPGFSPMVDFGLRMLTEESPEANYGARRQALLPTLQRHFSVERELAWPPALGRFLRLYTGLTLENPSSRDNEPTR